MKKTSTLSHGLIWFGAAVSIAEILTGTLIAPLGFKRGVAAILIGHLIGCVLLFFAGLIGAKTEKSAMETVKMSFGKQGGKFFAFLNVLQLVGWTAVMIVSGAAAANAIFVIGEWAWCLIIGVLIAIWILVGVSKLDVLNAIAMSALFVLTVVLSMVVFGGEMAGAEGSLSFGAAIELSVAMPLSWLPLVSDYTRDAKHPLGATAVSSIVYFFTSSWMYIIGLGVAIFTGEADIGTIMLKAGLGAAALLIIIFSTVTTTFLDAYSAGVSTSSIFSKIREKYAAVTVCILGIVLAIATPITRFEDFLYLIGSVFAPMIAIQIVDLFLKRDSSNKKIDIAATILWIIGFVLYRIFLNMDTPIGNTLPVMIIVALLTFLVRIAKK